MLEYVEALKSEKSPADQWSPKLFTYRLLRYSLLEDEEKVLLSISYLFSVKVAEIPIDDAIDIVSKAKPEGFHIFMMDFDDATYSSILSKARSLKIEPAELVKNIVIEWLNNSNG